MPNTTEALYEIKRTFTTASGEIDTVAVEAAAVAAFTDIIRKWQYRTLDDARAAYLRGAEHEQWDCADKAKRNAQFAAQQEAEAIDADKLAASHGYDADRLRFEHSRCFWGNSTRRSTDLPRFERALKIAIDREAAATPANRTWKIRDQLPTGEWGPEREVTLAQYRAELDAKGAVARAAFQNNKAALAAAAE